MAATTTTAWESLGFLGRLAGLLPETWLWAGVPRPWAEGPPGTLAVLGAWMMVMGRPGWAGSLMGLAGAWMTWWWVWSRVRTTEGFRQSAGRAMGGRPLRVGELDELPLSTQWGGLRYGHEVDPHGRCLFPPLDHLPLPAQKQIAHHVLAGRTLYCRDVAVFFQAATHHPVVLRVSRPLNGQTAAVTWAHLQDAVDAQVLAEVHAEHEGGELEMSLPPSPTRAIARARL